MINKRNILSLATLVVGASASGIFRNFGDKITQQANPCHITCPREYAPVCATDAETYENLCLFGVAKCMNRDLQLVANVTCPDLLIHLTHLAQKGMIESMNAINSTYQAFGNITKGTAEIISSTLESVPLITLPNFNLPIFGIPPVPPQILKTTSTSTTTTTKTTTSSSTTSSTTTSSTTTSTPTSTTASTTLTTTENTSTKFESDSTSSATTPTIEPTSTTSTSSLNNEPTSTSSISASSTSTSTVATSTKSSRKLIEIPSLEQGASGVIVQMTKTIQSALSGSGVSGSSPSTTTSSAALGLNNLDDARTTIEGMVKTIPYTPGKNSSNVLLVDGVSQIVKIPNGKDSKNLLSNITSPTESFNLPNITNLTNSSLSNITEKISNRNITLNGENLISNPNFQSLKNLTSSTLDNNNNGTNNGSNMNGTSLLTDSKLNKFINGRFNTTDIFKGIGNTISNISKNIKDQVENEIENIN